VWGDKGEKGLGVGIRREGWRKRGGRGGGRGGGGGEGGNRWRGGLMGAYVGRAGEVGREEGNG